MDMSYIMEQGEFFMRIVVAGLCGALIGYERKSRNKEAAIRTHLIVAIGATLMMLVSKYGFGDVIVKDGIDLDPSRIAAQIVSGVGFLGAGMIFMKKNTIRGLTTAAGIWATSGIGMCIGTGLYAIGIATSLLIVLVQILLHSNHRWARETYKEELTIQVSKEKNAIRDIKERLTNLQIEILSIKVSEQDNAYLVKMTVYYPDDFQSDAFLDMFESSSCIQSFDI